MTANKNSFGSQANPTGTDPVGHPVPAGRRPRTSRISWVVLSMVAIAAVVLIGGTAATGLIPGIPRLPGIPPSAPIIEVQATATPTPMVTPMPTPDPAAEADGVVGSATAEALPQPTVTAMPDPARLDQAPLPPTPAADEVLLRVTPEPSGVGWVRGGDDRFGHFADSFLHAGISQGDVFHGVVQFDLSAVSRGAPIRFVGLSLTGLDDKRLDRDINAAWEVRWLAPEDGERRGRRSFQEIHNASVRQTLLPALGPANLATARENWLILSPDQLALLERQLVDQQDVVTFRLDGPQTGSDNLFTWDSGYGSASPGNGPALLLLLGPPPPTPPPIPTREYIVVTSTPTPENVLTVAAMVQTATALAAQAGTPTITPRSMVTATPTPGNEATAQAARLRQGLPPVVVPIPEPGNDATATMVALYVTAQAMTTGTWTPTAPNAVTATATPTFVVIANTPTPGNISTRLAQVVAQLTTVATAGTPTPIPPGVVTATPRWYVVTVTPAPENAATIQAWVIEATIAALTTGTYTPTPANLAIATPTPTPTWTRLPLVMALTPTFTPEPLPAAIPESLRNKIVFTSDRLGAESLFVMDGQCAYRPGGCRDDEVEQLTQQYPYDLALRSYTFSPDGQARALVELENVVIGDGDLEPLPRVFVHSFSYDDRWPITPFSGPSYDPTWSPLGDRIALVYSEVDNDEIYVVRPDGSDLQRLTSNSWEWDKHPTWSPDGQQILFFSNRGSGKRQLWIMNADGSEQRNVSNNGYSDWNPIWIR